MKQSIKSVLLYVSAVILTASLSLGSKPWENYEEELDESVKEVIEIDLKTWQQFFNENQKMLVLFCKLFLFSNQGNMGFALST